MFNNLHVHTTYGSLLDSILKVDDMVQFAHKNKQTAIAVTDHGSMASFVNVVKECNKYNVKPIIGNEIYEVDNMWEQSDSKEYSQPRYHLVLLAKNQQGFQNLLKITSISKTDGFYKKPRIDMKYIKDNNLGCGIICLTGCQAGRLSKYLVNGNEESAIRFINGLKDIFDYVACEIQSHSTKEQEYSNQLIYNFSQKYNLPYVITTDAHMVSGKMQDSQAIFVEIGEGREVGESYVDCYLQTESDVHSILKSQFSKDIVQKGIDETEKIAQMVENIDIGLNRGSVMPKIQIKDGYADHKEYLRHLCFKTFDEKFGSMSEEDKDIRRKRIETELEVLYEVDYTDYFIMLHMLANEARKRKIPLGYSRGSGANCLCLFMLNVTQIDSVRWDLDFSRFANLGRKSMADYDWDISKRRRKEMVEISEELFGKENVAPICTFNSLSTKVAIKDIGKVLNDKEGHLYYGKIPYSLRDEVAKMIPTIKTLNDLGEEEEKDLLLKDILGKNKKLESVYEEFPLWFKYVMDLEGLPKSMGRHAAGTLITPNPVTDYCPLCLDKEKNTMIELEMHNAMDDLGLVKMDYLGLETLDVIDDTLKLAGISWEDVDINHLNLNDMEVFEQIYKSGNTVGIFQMESAEAKKMCIEAQADNIEDIIVVNAANRPGTKESFPIYCENKLSPDNAQVLHNDLKQIFNKTHCVLLYQEQALQLFRHAGFPENQVDNARRCIDENSVVLMSNGNCKKIKDIEIGECVTSLDLDGHMSYKRVINKFDNGIKKTYKIKTIQKKELNATGDHKLLTQDGWKRVDELTTNDYIMTPKKLNACRSYPPIDALKITSIEENKESSHVYDIEVEQNHNYVANGIIVHNCIGKKDKEKMKTLEIDFRDGLSKKGWNNEQLTEIWSLMLKQAEYCFNRGHAVSYGLLSYLTAYLKTHYTIYYMTSLLSSKSDKIEKISTVINDCKRLMIKVLPPNVNKSNVEFTAIPEDNSILFGLLAVKGLGLAVVEKIIKNRPYCSLKDFSEKVLDKKAIITLIKAGGIPTTNKMESLKKYATLIYEDSEYKDVVSLPKLSILKEKYNIDTDVVKDKETRLKLYNEKKRQEFNIARKEKFKNHMDSFYDKYAKDEYLWEFETLSMFLTNDPLVKASKYIESQWDNIGENERGVVCCVIVDIKRKKDKNGNQFAYLDLYTHTGIIEATIWSKQLKQYSDLIRKGKCLSILGRKREGNHLFVEEIKTYEQWLNDRKLSKLK